MGRRSMPPRSRRIRPGCSTQRWPDDFSTPRSCCEIRRRGRLSRSLGSELGWAKVLAALAEHGDVRAYVEQHRALWRCARAQIAPLEAALAEQQVAFAEPLRRLQTIPGVGPIVATTALAIFSEPGRSAT